MDPRKKLERGNPDLVAGHAKKGSGLRRLVDLQGKLDKHVLSHRITHLFDEGHCGYVTVGTFA